MRCAVCVIATACLRISSGTSLAGYSMQVGAHQLEPAKDVPELSRKQAVAMTQTAHRMFYAHQYHEK